MSKIYYNALIVNEGESRTGFVGVDGDTITLVGHGQPTHAQLDSFDESEDLLGRWLLPGAIDDQVHFRDPGLTRKADIESESRAAVAGGVTSFMDMPNTNPPTISITAWEDKCRRAAEVSAANYAFFLGATASNIDELRAADPKRVPGVKLFLGSSTGNMLVDREEALDAIFALPHLIAVHSEDENTIRTNARAATEKYGEGCVPIAEHPNIRSAEACRVSTERAIERARRLGTRLHILHLSTEAETQMLQPGEPDRKQITGEVCAHHLWFTDADYSRLGAKIKCNPAVKSASDRAALREALREGRVDIVATDHAPHLPADKEGDALHAASGLPLVQFSLPLMLEMARQGEWTKEDVVRWMCHAPAKLFGIEKRGYIREGYKADITVIDPENPYTVEAGMVISKCGWSPLEGTELHNRVMLTLVNGREVYRDGVLASPMPSAQPLIFRR